MGARHTCPRDTCPRDVNVTYQCEPVSAMCPSDHMLQAMAVVRGVPTAHLTM